MPVLDRSPGWVVLCDRLDFVRPLRIVLFRTEAAAREEARRLNALCPLVAGRPLYWCEQWDTTCVGDTERSEVR